MTKWADQGQRVVGHVVRCPPISLGAGSEGYTEDYAVVELDCCKFDKSAFRGNVVEFGTFSTISLRPSNSSIIYSFIILCRNGPDIDSRVAYENSPRPPHIR